MKKPVIKLMLHRETIKTLVAADLRCVAAGIANFPKVTTTFICKI